MTTGYAAIQNNIPIIHSLTVKNTSDEVLENIELKIQCAPAFAEPIKFLFEHLKLGESRRISPIDLKPDHSYLSKLDEAEMATIAVRASSGDQILSQVSHTIEVLAYNQWAGSRSLPELIAAFCMPNSVVVDRLLGKASALLSQVSGCTLHGYQSKNREHVWKIISALYSTLMAENIQYVLPPASFSSDGQKIRTPERIFDGRVATCLDLSMLFAACFEQSGLRPVVLFKERHAWVGVWLIDTSFSGAIVDDIQAIRKRVKSGELIVLEATGITNTSRKSLRRACSTAETYLEEEGTFQYAVDIYRARKLRILPLPSRSTSHHDVAEVSDKNPPGIEEMPDLPSLGPELISEVELDGRDTPEGRLTKWKSKLLDLTLRNRLINFKQTKTNVRLICHNLQELENILSEGKEFKLKTSPRLLGGSDPRSGEIYTERTGRKVIHDFVADSLFRRELVVDLPEDELDARLTSIFRASETGREEGGVNILFLAFGFLQWRESKISEVSYLAPILLVPVTLFRRSISSGFRLKRHDDDAIINSTLLQKLKKDFRLAFPPFEVLPTNEKGLDVKKIFQIFRLKVSEMAGWEVKEDVHLGIFSFTKYLMWKDLQDRQKQLQEHPVVAHLLNNPRKVFSHNDPRIELQTLDSCYRPQDLFVPMLSDSSQLRAICVAGEGTNLVLEGPPGTGKSQTIANLICHLLATGKTVLFVSEKMAALDVVHRRLNNIGLGPFCLELHSSKANKAEVLSQLDESLKSAAIRTVKEWEIEAERLSTLRSELNTLVEALHRPYPNDLTLYEAMGTVIKWSSKWHPAPMDWVNPDQHDRQKLDEIRSIVRKMVALAGQISDISEHPLEAIEKTSWTPSWQKDLLSACQDLADTAQKVQDLLVDFLQILGFDQDGASWDELALIDQLADILLRVHTTPIGVVEVPLDEVTRNHLKTLREHGIKRQEIWSGLHERFKESFSTLRAEEIEGNWQKAVSTWWPKSWFLKRRILRQIGFHSQEGKLIDESELINLLNNLRRLNKEDEIIVSMETISKQLLQDEYKAQETNWDLIAQHEKWIEDYVDILGRLSGGNLEVLSKLQRNLEPYLTDRRSFLLSDGMLGSKLIKFRDVWRILTEKVQKVTELAGRTESLVLDRHSRGALQRILSTLQGWQAARGYLQPWCVWRGIREKALVAGLGGVVRAVEAGNVPLSDMEDYFEFSYQSWWLNKTMDKEPTLCAFSSADHVRKIDEFRKSDFNFQKLTQQYVRAILSGRIPTTSNIEPGSDSEMGKLRHELQKQKRHLSIRQLIRNVPILLPKLKPCLLMSPLSVAQYLGADHPQFDVVIFDEASQIPVWDAVGVIARGKQLVCVGDPKQLPPTNFFNKVDDDEDEDNQDLESILDECLSIGLHNLSLKWHYRSRHESLIAFSNVTYYDNRLITFPSPVTEDSAVRIEFVHGVYDRGGSRTNKAEAVAIVEAIERYYLDPTMKKYSLGVVTFNQAQQALIEDLLDARRSESSKLDQAISSATVEPLFIKNIENVQGDERDVILFSITYGPDETGKVPHNFGPLNKEGGHRRLNVAVSRARHQVVIYSTMKPEQIDLSRARALGVRDLKNYIDFAMRGPRALVEQNIPTGLEPDSPFEREVIRLLRDRGWIVHPQVGVSGYRIDIGVVDPRAPGRYLLGVECDGRTYHSGATARDRDRLRQQVLEDLGWKLHRIWSTDWWRDKQQSLKNLLDKLEALVSMEPEKDQPSLDYSKEGITVPQDQRIDDQEPKKIYAGGTEGVAGPSISLVLGQKDLPVYHPVIIHGGPSEDFKKPEILSDLRAQLNDVIGREGPILEDILFNRIARAWGQKRTGKLIKKRLRSLLTKDVQKTREINKVFYWPKDINPESWKGFRVANREKDSIRHIDEISLVELGNMALFLLNEHGPISEEKLARSICRLQGIGKMSADAYKRIRQAFKRMRENGRMIIDINNRISLLSSNHSSLGKPDSLPG